MLIMIVRRIMMIIKTKIIKMKKRMKMMIARWMRAKSKEDLGQRKGYVHKCLPGGKKSLR